MKIGQAPQPQAPLIERMQKAHAETKCAQDHVAMPQAAPASQAKTPSSLERAIMQIAQRVLQGELTEAKGMRRQVIEVIVDERFKSLIDPSKRARTIEMLEVNLSEDPAFTREIDDMLILAARAVTT